MLYYYCFIVNIILCISRIEAEFISNSVAIFDFEVNVGNNNNNKIDQTIIKSIKKSKFYWGTQPDGTPSSLFIHKKSKNNDDGDNNNNNSININSSIISLNSTNNTSITENTKYWPYNGISIIMNRNEETKDFDQSYPINIFVLGQVVIPLSTASFLGNDVLSFSINHSLGYIITNPYDAPDLWDYSPINLPKVIRNRQTNNIIAHLNWYLFIYIHDYFILLI